MKRVVEILGHKYKIRYTADAEDPDLMGGWGCVNHINLTITVYKTGTNIERVNILLHEIFHAVDAQLGLALFDADNAHDKMNTLVPVLLDTLLKNKLIKLDKL